MKGIFYNFLNNFVTKYSHVKLSGARVMKIRYLYLKLLPMTDIDIGLFYI
jgi:hypothetical protein